MSSDDWVALFLTFKLAFVTTLCLLAFGTPLAWWLSRTQSRVKIIFEALISLPLILPPTVLGFYLLVLFGSQSPLGQAIESVFDAKLVFSFWGLVVGSVVYSLPFVVQPLQNSFSSIDEKSLESASMLGASPLKSFMTVAMPLARPGFITAAVLGFAHTLGEFGVVLMIGGSIPGETKVASIAIYEHVESLQYGSAHMLAGLLMLISFLLLVFVFAINRRFSLLPR